MTTWGFSSIPRKPAPRPRPSGPKVPRREARRRARLLKALQAKIVKARLKSLVGSVAEVLVEGVSPESDYLLTGRLISQAPDIDGQVYITAGTGQVGEIQPVRLTRALPYDLLGEIVEAEEERKRVDASKLLETGDASIPASGPEAGVGGTLPGSGLLSQVLRPARRKPSRRSATRLGNLA